MEIIVKRPFRLTELDERLLELLEQDSRISFKTLAGKLGSTPKTVKKRMEELRDAGEIVRYTINRREPRGQSHYALVRVYSKGGSSWELAVSIKRAFPEVFFCTVVQGKADIVLLLQAPAITEIDMVTQALEVFPGIKRIRTQRVIEVIGPTQI